MDLVRKGFGENRAIIVSVLATIVAVIIFQAINPFFLSRRAASRWSTPQPTSSSRRWGSPS